MYYNTNRTAINEGIFNKHLQKYHVQDIHQNPPSYTICIQSLISHMKHNGAYKKCPNYIQNLVHTCCGDCHVKNDNQFVDPLLKLYVSIPVMITDNIDVSGNMANGTYGRF